MRLLQAGCAWTASTSIFDSPPIACTPSAKAHPGDNGSAGNGGISHLMAGQVQFMAESIPQAAAYHKQGKVRALAVTAKLNDAFRQVLTTPDIRNRMVSQGADPAFLGSEDFAKFLTAESPKWADAVAKSGAKLD